MDAAASEMFQEDAAMYYFPGETKSLIWKNAKIIEQNQTQETECNCEGTHSNDHIFCRRQSPEKLNVALHMLTEREMGIINLKKCKPLI